MQAAVCADYKVQVLSTVTPRSCHDSTVFMSSGLAALLAAAEGLPWGYLAAGDDAYNAGSRLQSFSTTFPPLLEIVSSLEGPSFLSERVASRSRLPVNRTNERLSIAMARRSTSSSGGNSLLGWIFARSNPSMALSIAKPWSVLALSAP